MAEGRGASAWWYGVAVAIGLATVGGIVWRTSGGTESFTRLIPTPIGYVEDGNVDRVVHLSKGTYSIVYSSDTLTRPDRVPRAALRVRGGPIDDIRTLTVHNNPADAKVILAYDYSGPSTTLPPVVV